MSALWNELHKRALSVKIDDSAYLKQFAKRIPRYTRGCKCNEHWVKYVKANPPTFGEKYFEWTVKAHNNINLLISIPLLIKRHCNWINQPQAPPEKTNK